MNKLTPEDFRYLSEVALYSTICFVVIACCVALVMGVAFWKVERGAAASLVRLIERANVLQMITVIVIVIGACILATIGKITSEGIVSILSGIAGYVLGNATRSAADSATRSSSKPEPTTVQPTTVV